MVLAWGWDTMLFVDSALARRLEIAAAWRGIEYARAVEVLHLHLDTDVEPVAGGYAIYAGPSSPVNRAAGLGLDGPVSSADLERVEQFYRRRRATPRIDVCPLASPSLLALSGAKGYRLERFFSVLIQPLAPKGVDAQAGSDVRVGVAGPTQGELWLRTVAQGFDNNEEPSPATLDMLAPNFASATATCFLAWLGDEPAGGGALVIHEGVAELCSASTRPAFRRHGVQAALLQARLRAAREAGCDLAMALTSPGTASQRNAERAGFHLAYTKAILVGP
jgi:GNAT superfamily N-acetyltransferase